MPEQNPTEMEWLLDQIKGSKSILEIGSRTGEMLSAMAGVCAPGARVCSIDIGDNERGYTGKALIETVTRLRDRGYNAEVLIADSKSDEAIAWAGARAPFEFVFIDGDHSYEGASADWLNYARMAGRFIAFHDIIDEVYGVHTLWSAIKATKHYSTTERRAINSTMGIGLVYL